MKEKTEGSGNTLLLMVILIILLLVIAFGITKLSDGDGGNSVKEKASAEMTTQVTTVVTTVTTTVTTTQPVMDIELGIDDYDLYSSAAVLADKNGNIVYSMNADEQIYPASLTKIMTAIVAIENIDDLSATVSIPGDIFDYINAENASTAGFSAYETVSFNDLLHGTLLSSGAECSLALAVYVGGSEDMFVRMMNEKAAEIGMNDTSFTNVCGLHNYEHYSTAADLSLLLNYALKNDKFREIFTTPKYYTSTDYQTEVALSSTMFIQMESSEFSGGEFLGGKTGYTSEAGLCLASLAKINGEEYTLVTVGADGSYATDPLNIYDAYTVYETLAQKTSPY